MDNRSLSRTDKLKLLSLLATESFDEIDRGEFEVVDPDRLEEFIAGLGSAAGPNAE